MSDDAHLPNGWVFEKLRGLSPRIVDGSHNPPPKQDSGVPMLSARNVADGSLVLDDYRLISEVDFRDEDRRTNVRPGDVLLTIVGTIGRSTVVPIFPDRFALQRSVAVLRPVCLRPAFCMYQLQSPALQRALSKQARGTAQKGVYLKALGELLLKVPPLDEQDRIVAKIEELFSDLDAGVAALERVRANLKRYRASVLKAAVEGKLTEDWRAQHPDTEPASVLLDRILTERRRQWEHAQLDRFSQAGKQPPKGWQASYAEPERVDAPPKLCLPSGWCWATWEQLSKRVTVGHVGSMKHEYVDQGVPFLRSQNVRENRFDKQGLLYITPRFHTQLAKSVVRPGDLAVVRSGSVGVTCVIPEWLGEANCSDLVLIQNPSGILPDYGGYYMNSEARRLVKAGTVGIALTHFNTRSVASLPVPLPPAAEQEQIVAEVGRRLSVIDEIESQVDANLKRAARLRQGILKRAFEGRLVPQDPTDEPASALLERLRTAPVAANRGRRRKATPEG